MRATRDSAALWFCVCAVLAGLGGAWVTRAQLPDPAAEGWDGEAFSDVVDARLKGFGEAVLVGGDGSRLSEFALEEAAANRLRPALEVVFAEPPVVVRRGDPGSDLAPLAAGVKALLAPFAEGKAERYEFKTHRVSVERMSSDHFVAISGRTAGDGGVLEQHAEWSVEWARGAGGDLKIRSVRASRFEETSSARPALFADATGAVLGGDAAFREQYCFGNNHWRPRIDAFNRIFKFGHNGLAIGDADGDGLDDVYSTQTGGLPNRLFIQQADGSVRDGAKAAGVDFLDSTRSALFVDLDNDGDQDLVLALNGGLMMMRNDGTGNFESSLRYPMVTNGFGLAAADYDADGLVDIYVCRYYDDAGGGARLALPAPYFDANNGGANFLLRNEGAAEGRSWISFSDATQASGLAANNRRFSFAAVWDDLDNDGDPDLYVANDFGKNALYLNRDGRFVEATAAASLEDSAFGMSVSSADYDRDGVSDLYVGNMFSAAGSRITRQQNFRTGADEALLPVFQRLARGNSLFRSSLAGDGPLRYADVSLGAGVELGRWSWGSVFVDFNNDGWEDLFVANGFITGPRADDL